MHNFLTGIIKNYIIIIVWESMILTIFKTRNDSCQKSKQKQARARYARTKLLILNYELRSLPSRDPFLVIILTYR